MKKGDKIYIEGYENSFYAYVEYVGKTKDGKYKFVSDTYGDLYFVDIKNRKIVREDSKEEYTIKHIAELQTLLKQG